jgi:hypothetical protein
MKLKYFGWSSFGLESENGTLYFDPFFRKQFGFSWSTIEDYSDAKVVCVTHGHADHLIDAPEILRTTDALCIAGRDITEHYMKKNNVSANRLVALNDFETITVAGFKITAFKWGHKEMKLSAWKIINMLKTVIFNGAFSKMAGYMLMNQKEALFSAIPMGFHVETPDGIKVLNYCEGFNDDTNFKRLEELGGKFETDILLAGASFDWEDYVARGAVAISPKTVILFTPHEPDRYWGLPYTANEVFVDKVKNSLPNADVIWTDPGYTKVFTK